MVYYITPDEIAVPAIKPLVYKVIITLIPSGVDYVVRQEYIQGVQD